MADEKTKQLTPEEQVEYLQGQLAYLGTLCSALMRTVLSPDDLSRIKKGLLDPSTFGENKERKTEFKAGFHRMKEFVNSL